MADNVTVDNGGLTDYTVASDDDATSQHQYVKLEWGPDGTFTKVGAGANALPIADGGNSITVDGTVAVTDGGGSLTVDGTVSVSGAIDTELPAAAALADNTANPTVPAVGAFNMGWDGATWDRIRAPGGVVEVSDAGGSLTVDGTVAISGAIDTELPAAAALADNAANPTAPAVGAFNMGWDGTNWDRIRAPGGLVEVADGGGSLTVDGTVAISAVTPGVAATSLGKAEDAVHTTGDVGVMALAVRNDAGTAFAADGDYVPLSVDSSGALRTAGGAGGTQYDEDTAHVSGDKLTMAGAVQQTADAALAADGDRAVLQVDSTGYLKVNVKAGGSGGTQYAEDTASAAADLLTMAGVVRKDAAATLVDTDGDRSQMQVDATGYLWTRIGPALPAGGNNIGAVDTELPAAAALADNTANPTVPAVGAFNMGWDGTNWDRIRAPGGVVEMSDAGGSITVDGTVAVSGSVDTELPAAAALADNVGNPTAPAVGAFAMGWDGTNWDRIRAPGGIVEVADGGGSLTIDGTVTANQGTAGAAWEVIGDVAHDVAAPANPVVVGGQMETMADSAPATRAGTDADAVKLAAVDGALYVVTTAPQTWSYHENSSSALTDASVHAAPGAGLSLYVTDICVSTGAATALNVFFEEGATTVLGPYYLEAVAGRGMKIHFQTPKKITANTALTITTSAAIAHGIDVLGFIAPG